MPAAEARTLHGWKIVIGGSALPRRWRKAALERGIDVWAGYGMSETCPTLSQAQLKPEALRADRGRARSTLRCKSGLPLAAGRDAHRRRRHEPAAARRPVDRRDRRARTWLTQAYHGNPDASKALWEGGYLHTQDIGSIDADGYLQITDRLKDVIKSGGEWVSSIEVEDPAGQHAGVAEAAVFGVKDDKWGERPVALVVRRASRRGASRPRPQLKAAPDGIRRERGQYLEVRGSGDDPLRRCDRQDQRRQDQQARAARPVRAIPA